MGEKYETNAAEIIGQVIGDLTTGSGAGGALLRDLGDQYTPFTGVKETFADIALAQFPLIWAAAAAQVSAKLKAVTITAEKP